MPSLGPFVDKKIQFATKSKEILQPFVLALKRRPISIFTVFMSVIITAVTWKRLEGAGPEAGDASRIKANDEGQAGFASSLSKT